MENMNQRKRVGLTAVVAMAIGIAVGFAAGQGTGYAGAPEAQAVEAAPAETAVVFPADVDAMGVNADRSIYDHLHRY
jgi:hypothetical protein